jgi:TolB-like protein
MSILNSLKKRKIGQWSLAYAAGAWVVIQIVDVMGGRWGVSETLARSIDITLITGFFLVVTVAWYHGDKGHQKIFATELLLIAIFLVFGAVGVLTTIRTDENPPPGQQIALEDQNPSRYTAEAPWIAVLPFRKNIDTEDLDGFAAGLTTRINFGLASFSHLLVVSQSSVEKAAERLSDPHEIGAAVGARYLMEGDLRAVDETLRLTVQLTDATDGKQVWSTQADYDLRDIDGLALQDAIADRVIASVGDSSGAVTRALASDLESKPPESTTAYEAVLQWTVNRQRGGPELHFRARTALERAVELEPNDAFAWACLAHVYVEEYMSNYNPLPRPLERGLSAAKRAVTLDRSDSFAHYSLAMAQYFSRNLDAFRVAADRSIELNPYDASVLAMLGTLISFSGDWEAGLEITKRARQINPDHPGYYKFSLFYDQYLKGNNAAALDIALQINMPYYYVDALVRVLAHVQNGNLDAANDAAMELTQLFPNFEADFGRLGLTNWFFAQPALVDRIASDLSEVGLTSDWTID